MKLHRIQIVETGDLSTERLFGLSLGLIACARDGRWPSAAKANTLLQRGFDDGEIGTDIKWEPFELSGDEYQSVVDAVMNGREYAVDSSELDWDEWREIAFAE